MPAAARPMQEDTISEALTLVNRAGFLVAGLAGRGMVTAEGIRVGRVGRVGPRMFMSDQRGRRRHSR